MTSINDAASRKSFAHYVLKPIAISLEMVDIVSSVPLSAAACAATVVAAPAIVLINEARRPSRSTVVLAEEPKLKPTETE